MATAKLVDAANGPAGSVDLDPTVFEAPVKPYLLHAEVRRQLARRRAGTTSTKNRAATSGGGSKPYRQKGMGRARQGTTRAPQYAGGGVVFGPVPRRYDHALPKKVRQAALRSALSLRFGEEAVTVVDALQVDEFKTRRIVEILTALHLEESSVLIVIEDADPKLEKSARNLARVKVVRAEGLNVYDVLDHQRLLITQGALGRIHQRLGAPVGEPAS